MFIHIFKVIILCKYYVFSYSYYEFQLSYQNWYINNTKGWLVPPFPYDSSCLEEILLNQESASAVSIHFFLIQVKWISIHHFPKNLVQREQTTSVSILFPQLHRKTPSNVKYIIRSSLFASCAENSISCWPPYRFCWFYYF